MSTTTAPTASFLSDVESFFTFIGKAVQSWFTSATGQTVSKALASVAGQAAGYELINNIQSTDKKTVATDVMVIGAAAVQLFSGTTPPSLTQVQGVFSALKSNETTTLFAPLAQAAATAITGFIGTNDGGETGSGQWEPVAQAFIQGLMAAAEAFGATTPVATPAAA